MSKQDFPGGNEVSELFGNSLAWRFTPRIQIIHWGQCRPSPSAADCERIQHREKGA